HDGVSPENIEAGWPKTFLHQLWKVPVNGGFSSFVVGGGKAYTLELKEVEGVDSEVCIALDINTGKRIWTAPLAPANFLERDPTGGPNRGPDGNQGGDGPRSTPCIDGNRIYVITANT